MNYSRVWIICITGINLRSRNTDSNKEHKARVAQRSTERTMLGLSLRDRVPNTEVKKKKWSNRCRPKNIDVKMELGGTSARINDGRWTRKITE